MTDRQSDAVDALRAAFADVPEEDLRREIDSARHEVRMETYERVKIIGPEDFLRLVS